MNFLKKIFGSSSTPKNEHTFTVKCKRCGEIIHGRVNLENDLSLEFENDTDIFYHTRKVLIGENKCFQQIEVQFKFSSDKQMIEQEIIGGEFVS